MASRAPAESGAIETAPYRASSISTAACVPWRQLAGEQQAWKNLADRSADPNPFYESWYLLPSLARLDHAGDTAVFRAVRDGELVGLLPITRQRNYWGWPLAHLGNWLHSNIFYGAPLVAAGAEEYFWRSLLDWADENTRLPLFLHLKRIALAGPVYEGLKSVLADDGRPWGVVERKERALLSSRLDADAYLQKSLSARKRKDLNRRFRRLNEVGDAAFRWETGASRLDEWIDEFLALEASGWKGESGSALACDDAKTALFRDSLKGAGTHERLIRLSLRVDGKPIAMLSTFLTPPGAFGFKTAFDEDYARFAPGLLLEREFVSVLRRFGIRWCDSCAAADHSVMNRMWQERRPIGRVSIAIGGRFRRAVFAPIVRREMAGIVSGAQA